MSWPFGDPWILVAAVALDLAFGDPPNRLHPVAWMGRLIASLARITPKRTRWRPFLWGTGIVILGVLLCGGVGMLVILPKSSTPWLGVAAEILLLKSAFSLRGLATAATRVQQALSAGDLVEARRLLAWHLVSRETANLDEARVAAAAVESVAENASDGVIAPWMFYLLAGLPGALAYRFVNTADAMLGYRDVEREWLGKMPARLDDLLNVLPARLSAAFILLMAPVAGGRWSRAVRVWWHDAGKTASPNAGQPMSAAAGALGIELEKVGCYRLGDGLRLPTATDIGRAVRLLYAVAGLALMLGIGSAFLRRIP